MDRFIPLQEYDPISLTTVSTCRFGTGAALVENPAAEAARNSPNSNIGTTNRLWQPGSKKKFCMIRIIAPALFHINLFQEYLALFPRIWYHRIRKMNESIFPERYCPQIGLTGLSRIWKKSLHHGDLTKEIQNIIR